MKILTQRIYDEKRQNGYRVLVDRLWPRGVSKEEAALDAWAKELAPSTELRQWFHKDMRQWEEFRTRYLQELTHHEDAAQALLASAAKHEALVLLYSARDEERNHAQLLREHLTRLHIARKPRPYASSPCYAGECEDGSEEE